MHGIRAHMRYSFAQCIHASIPVETIDLDLAQSPLLLPIVNKRLLPRWDRKYLFAFFLQNENCISACCEPLLIMICINTGH